MSNRTWKLTVNEDELKSILAMHLSRMLHGEQNEVNTERSARIHDLTKRLNKETPEIENVETVQPQKETW